MSGELTGTELAQQVASNLQRSDKTSEITTWLKLALNKVYQDWRFEGLESTASFVTTEDLETYELNVDILDLSGNNIFKVVRVTVTDGTTKYSIRLTSKEELENTFSDESTGKPELGCIWGNTLYLRPIPSGEYTVNLDTLIKPSEVGGNEVCVLTGVDKALINLATAYGFDNLNEPNLALSWHSQYLNELRSALDGDKKPTRLVMQPFQGGTYYVPTQSGVHVRGGKVY